MPLPSPRHRALALAGGLGLAALLAGGPGCARDDTGAPAVPPASASPTGTVETTARSRPSSDPTEPTGPTGPTTQATQNPPSGMGEGEGNAIRKVDFANATYPADACGTTFVRPPAGGYVLRDGSASGGGATPASEDFSSLTLRADIAYGDFTGDGADDAALILDCNVGNRPIPFGWVYTMTSTGPTVLGGVHLPDDDAAVVGAVRGSLLDLEISNGKLESHWALFTASDPACCPSMRGRLTQRWTGQAFETDGRLTTVTG